MQKRRCKHCKRLFKGLEQHQKDYEPCRRKKVCEQSNRVEHKPKNGSKQNVRNVGQHKSRISTNRVIKYTIATK